MPEESEVIYWVIDEGGNVLLDPSPPAGDYNVGDRLTLEGKTRSVWVKTVVDAE
jgi:hypothetical protein